VVLYSTEINPIIITTQQFEPLSMLLMKVSAIIIEIVAVVAPYDAITTILHHFIPGNLANWHNYAFIMAAHDYVTVHCFM